MSKIAIRNGMFETNSSSVHSICISKKPVDNVRGRKLNFYSVQQTTDKLPSGLES